MKTLIFSLEELEAALENRPELAKTPMVSIRERPQGPEYEFLDRRKDLNVFSIVFHDIDREVPGIIAPSRGAIESILEFAKDKENVIVHCTAGASRSAAVAYLIECQKKEIPEALKILDPNTHNPNLLVARLGADILGDPQIYERLAKWQKDAVERFWSEGSEEENSARI